MALCTNGFCTFWRKRAAKGLMNTFLTAVGLLALASGAHAALAHPTAKYAHAPIGFSRKFNAAGSDQGFLQQFFRENEGFLSLPHAYNVLKRREKKLGKSFRIQDVFVLHLVGGKPWEPGDPGAGEYPLSHGAWHAIRRECGLPDDGY